MGLILIHGSPRSGKTRLLMTELARAAATSQPVLLVPTAPDALRLTRDLADRRCVGVRVSTIGRWTEELWGIHGDGRRFVGTAARAALLGRTIEECDLGELGMSASTPGFELLFADIVKRLSNTPRPNQTGIPERMAALIDSYESRLERAGLVEPARALGALADLEISLPGPLGVALFADLSPAQEGLLMGLGTRNTVFLSLSWEEHHPAYAAIDPLVKRFSENAERTSVCVARASVQDEVAAFSGALFVGGSPLRPSGAIAFGEAAGEDGENALVAREVMALVAAGVRPEEVAVVFRHAGSRMASLVSTLQSTGVPVAADVSEAFKRTSFGGALLGLMGACSHAGAEREQLLAFLHSPYSGCTHEVAGRVDGLLRRRGVEASRMVHVASAELDVAGRRILTDARALMAMTVGEESISKWQHLTGRLFANAWTGEALKSRGAALDAAAHSRFLEAVSELAFADGGATATDLLRSLRSVRVSAGASSEFTGVLVTEAHRLRGRTVRALVIGGLSVDEFSSEGHESLAASMGESLGQPAGPDQGLFERMLFHELVSRATEHLILIRRYVDEDGAALRPSAFWDEALDVYRSRDEALEGVLPAGLRLARIDTGEALELSSGSGARRALLRAHPAKSAPVETRRGEADDRLREEMATREEFSVSELEVYLSCPYRWFFERALRSRSLDVTFEARERGSLAHELVAAFYREWSSRELGRVTAASMDEALVVFEGVKEHILARAGRPGPRDLREEMGVARAVRWARSIIEKDAEWLPGFEPLHHEFGFGAEPQDAFGFAGVRLRGSIDRVDVSGRGIVVTDYKSTSEIKGVASFATYGLIQLPVYAAAAARILELPILAGLYRSFNSGGARGFWVSGNDILVQGGSASDSVEDVEGVLAGAVAMVEEAVAGIRAADITPRPRGAGVCAFCGARPVCPEVR